MSFKQTTNLLTDVMPFSQTTNLVTDVMPFKQSTMPFNQSTNFFTEVMPFNQSTERFTDVMPFNQSTDSRTDVMPFNQSTDSRTHVNCHIYKSFSTVCTVFLVTHFVLNLFVNVPVVVIGAVNRRVQEIRNLYVVALSLADTLVSFNSLLAVVWLNEDDLRDQVQLCNFFKVYLYATLFCSLTTLTLVAFDRFVFIRFPFFYLNTITMGIAAIFIAISWVGSVTYVMLMRFDEHPSDRYCSGQCDVYTLFYQSEVFSHTNSVVFLCFIFMSFLAHVLIWRAASVQAVKLFVTKKSVHNSCGPWKMTLQCKGSPDVSDKPSQSQAAEPFAVDSMEVDDGCQSVLSQNSSKSGSAANLTVRCDPILLAKVIEDTRRKALVVNMFRERLIIARNREGRLSPIVDSKILLSADCSVNLPEERRLQRSPSMQISRERRAFKHWHWFRNRNKISSTNSCADPEIHASHSTKVEDFCTDDEEKYTGTTDQTDGCKRNMLNSNIDENVKDNHDNSTARTQASTSEVQENPASTRGTNTEFVGRERSVSQASLCQKYKSKRKMSFKNIPVIKEISWNLANHRPSRDGTEVLENNLSSASVTSSQSQETLLTLPVSSRPNIVSPRFVDETNLPSLSKSDTPRPLGILKSSDGQNKKSTTFSSESMKAAGDRSDVNLKRRHHSYTLRTIIAIISALTRDTRELTVVKLKIMRKLTRVFVCLSVCWLPLIVLGLLGPLEASPDLVMAFGFLVLLNSTANSFVYAWSDGDIRGAMKETCRTWMIRVSLLRSSRDQPRESYG